MPTTSRAIPSTITSHQGTPRRHGADALAYPLSFVSTATSTGNRQYTIRSNANRPEQAISRVRYRPGRAMVAVQAEYTWPNDRFVCGIRFYRPIPAWSLESRLLQPMLAARNHLPGPCDHSARCRRLVGFGRCGIGSLQQRQLWISTCMGGAGNERW